MSMRSLEKRLANLEKRARAVQERDAAIEYEYLEFKLDEEKPKTKVWHVLSKNAPAFLGAIKWHGPWRRYVFFASPHTLFDAGCLKEVVQFLEMAMEVHKANREKEKA